MAITVSEESHQYDHLAALDHFLSVWLKLESSGRRNLKWENASIRLACGKAVGVFLVCDRWGPRPLWAASFLHSLSYVAEDSGLSQHGQAFSICASGVQKGSGIEGQQTDSRLVSKRGNFFWFISVWLFDYLLMIWTHFFTERNATLRYKYRPYFW